jgi:hypothetical protein
MRHELLNLKDLDGTQSFQDAGTRRRFAAGSFGMLLPPMRVRNSTVAIVMVMRCDRVRPAMMVRRPSMGSVRVNRRSAGAVTHRSSPGRRYHEED